MGKHKDSKRENVLIAAEEVFMKKGLKGARTVEIAQKAGVTHAVLHYWFNTKEELFNVILVLAAGSERQHHCREGEEDMFHK